MSSDLQGRTAVVFGVANKRSIAWSIAQGLHAAGMKLAITYQNERLAADRALTRCCSHSWLATSVPEIGS